jgi:hypothetical protein
MRLQLTLADRWTVAASQSSATIPGQPSASATAIPGRPSSDATASRALHPAVVREIGRPAERGRRGRRPELLFEAIASLAVDGLGHRGPPNLRREPVVRVLVPIHDALATPDVGP